MARYPSAFRNLCIHGFSAVSFAACFPLGWTGRPKNKHSALKNTSQRPYSPPYTSPSVSTTRPFENSDPPPPAPARNSQAPSVQFRLCAVCTLPILPSAFLGPFASPIRFLRVGGRCAIGRRSARQGRGIAAGR